MLVEKVFLYGQPGLVRLVGIKGALADIEIDSAGNDARDLVEPGDQGLKAAARNQVVRDPIRLVGRLNEEFADSSDVV